MGELHLEIIVDRMKREFKVEANVGAPQVAYRETITRESREVDYTHKKQTRRLAASSRHVKLMFEPRPTGSGFEFENKVIGGTVPKEYIPGVEKGLNEAIAERHHRRLPDGRRRGPAGRRRLPRGRLLGAGLQDRLLAGASRRASTKAGPQLLEPVMRVEVVTPEDYMGDIIGDLNSRRGQITGMEPRGNGQVINAVVPLATMFGYVNTLRSLSQGRAQFTMHFDHYEPVPQIGR